MNESKTDGTVRDSTTNNSTIRHYTRGRNSPVQPPDHACHAMPCHAYLLSLVKSESSIVCSCLIIIIPPTHNDNNDDNNNYTTTTTTIPAAKKNGSLIIREKSSTYATPINHAIVESRICLLLSLVELNYLSFLSHYCIP